MVDTENAFKERGLDIHPTPSIKVEVLTETQIHRWHWEHSRSLLTEKKDEPIKHQQSDF